MKASHDPSRWSEAHSSAWERSKKALRRDWEQTKDWDEELQAGVRKDWETTLTDTPWVRVIHAVRRGWDSAKGPAPAARR